MSFRDRLERWADWMDRVVLISQLVVGALLVVLLDLNFIARWRLGQPVVPRAPILTLIIPVLVTSGWLLLVSFLLRRAARSPAFHTVSDWIVDIEHPQPGYPCESCASCEECVGDCARCVTGRCYI